MKINPLIWIAGSAVLGAIAGTLTFQILLRL